MIEKRSLGRNGLGIGCLGYGAMGLEGYYGALAFVDSGYGVIGGPRPNHPDLERPGIIVDNYTSEWGDGFGHGTLVAGMAVGDPIASPPGDMTAADGAGYLFGMGVAPGTAFVAQKVFGEFGNMVLFNPLTVANNAYYWNAAVQNHSYTYFGTAGQYDSNAQIYDLAIRDTYGDAPITSMPMTIAAGNICQNEDQGGCTTLVQSPGTAKNAITVGGVESWRPNAFTQCVEPATDAQRSHPGDFQADSYRNVAWSSRRGTADGRVKPEIVAPMTQISSTRTQYNPNFVRYGGWMFCNHTADAYYSFDSGTSFSAPQAAGACMLLNRKYNTRFSPAMLKAALVGNSLSVRGGLDRQTGSTVPARGPAWNQSQGFGRLYLGEALSGQVTQTLLDEWAWTPFTGPGQVRTRSFTTSDLSRPVVIVLAWTDEPATPYVNPTYWGDPCHA